jgi:hypothetical protein
MNRERRDSALKIGAKKEAVIEETVNYIDDNGRMSRGRSANVHILEGEMVRYVEHRCTSDNSASVPSSAWLQTSSAVLLNHSQGTIITKNRSFSSRNSPAILWRLHVTNESDQQHQKYNHSAKKK